MSPAVKHKVGGLWVTGGGPTHAKISGAFESLLVPPVPLPYTELVLGKDVPGAVAIWTQDGDSVYTFGIGAALAWNLTVPAGAKGVLHLYGDQSPAPYYANMNAIVDGVSSLFQSPQGPGGSGYVSNVHMWASLPLDPGVHSISLLRYGGTDPAVLRRYRFVVYDPVVVPPDVLKVNASFNGGLWFMSCVTNFDPGVTYDVSVNGTPVTGGNIGRSANVDLGGGETGLKWDAVFPTFGAVTIGGNGHTATDPAPVRNDLAFNVYPPYPDIS